MFSRHLWKQCIVVGFHFEGTFSEKKNTARKKKVAAASGKGCAIEKALSTFLIVRRHIYCAIFLLERVGEALKQH